MSEKSLQIGLLLKLMDRFGQAFTDAATQLSKVKQYYEFSWDDEAFEMTLPSMHGRHKDK